MSCVTNNIGSLFYFGCYCSYLTEIIIIIIIIIKLKREAEDATCRLNAQVIFSRDDIVIAEENFTNWRIAWKKLKNMMKKRGNNVKINGKSEGKETTK